jgi:hypothetical protein
VKRVARDQRDMAVPASILFLDIDGVMNTTDSILKHKSNRVFTGESISCLRTIVAQTGCSIVISSTWREDQQWKILPGVFSRNGLSAVLARIIDRTPVLPPGDGPTREDEIDCWLCANGYDGPYAILDDISFAGEHACRLVQTTTEKGLTRHECERVLAMLGPSRRSNPRRPE